MGLVLFYATILNIILGLVLLNPAFTYYLIYIIFLLTLFVIYVVLTVLGRPSKKNWSVKMFNRLFRGKQSRRRRRSSAVGLHARAGSSGEGANGVGGSASGVLNGDVIMEEDETEDSDDSEYDDGDEVNVGEGEAEEELSKREVVIMTIPKRRLTVVNA
ncbi:hypothetical protein BKA69DRAFT_1084079 [Paraphysoderma sedebokerense]|nr:hypothetical protein BKA69DRAFT_1084079 [Paraphysoderma sedebokerense]